MFGLFGHKKDKKICNSDDKEELMSGLQSKLEEGSISFEEAKSVIGSKMSDFYKNIMEDRSGKILMVSIVGNRWADPYVSIAVMTYSGFIISEGIEHVPIDGFDIEKDDISNIEGRKVSILRIGDDCIVKIHSNSVNK